MTWAPHQERFPHSIDGNENRNRQPSVRLDGRLSTAPVQAGIRGMSVQGELSVPSSGDAEPGVISGIDQAFMNGSE